MAKDEARPAEACPVDEATRAVWLQSKSTQSPFPGLPTPKPSSSPPETISTISEPSVPKVRIKHSWLSDLLWTPRTDEVIVKPTVKDDLGIDREISTIPRASVVGSTVRPANGEKESGASEGGNWVYPSEKMFFEAMKRKGRAGDAKDMRTVVPIHNAVNERAWKEIKEWERPWGSDEKCGGPKLDSFLGLPMKLSPKARMNAIMGYMEPFDRHDWVVDRCGTKVEYIIDFYKGSDKNANGRLNFYLDVRPKLNTFEGWKMRAAKVVGL
ncbi:cytochrome c/c1 heme-lyase, partial [Calycina marina]